MDRRPPNKPWHYEALRLESQGYRYSEIARIVGKLSDTVRNYLNPYAGAKDRALRRKKDAKRREDPEYRARKAAKVRAHRARSRDDQRRTR